MREVRTSLDLGLAREGLGLASTKLGKDDLEGAEQALGVVMSSLHFTVLAVDLPLDQARENLMLAKDASKAGKKASSKLRDKMKSLERTLEAGDVNKGFVATIEGWWDRIGKFMKSRPTSRERERMPSLLDYGIMVRPVREMPWNITSSQAKTPVENLARGPKDQLRGDQRRARPQFSNDRHDAGGCEKHPAPKNRIADKKMFTLQQLRQGLHEACGIP